MTKQELAMLATKILQIIALLNVSKGPIILPYLFRQCYSKISGFSAENTINNQKTLFWHSFYDLVTFCLHIQNLQHVTVVINTHIPQKTCS